MLTERQIDDAIAACDRIEKLNEQFQQICRNIITILEPNPAPAAMYDEQREHRAKHSTIKSTNPGV